MENRTVSIIPAMVNRFTSAPASKKQKRKVAGYARVSSDKKEQLTSYESQIRYYTDYIKNHDDWEFVGMYADEGITGTSIKHREGFKKMVKDALEGKIDLIITKSVSRFARNTVDSLTTIRKLKENGIECYFEKENIWTFDSKGELLITIMSSIAQEEARSISENCTWGQRRRFAEGKVSVPYLSFLGYDKGNDGNLTVNKEQAKVVRRIYGMFLQGQSFYSIAKKLTTEGFITPFGKTTWYASTIKSILTNEKYKGDALLQKTYTSDFLTKKKKINTGEIPQYYVKNNHEAIIEPKVFDAVQMLIQKIKSEKGKQNSTSIFSSKIKCGDCGEYYGSKVWHSNDKYRKVVWQCNHKFYNEKKCTTPHLDENQIKEIFITAVNTLTKNKAQLLSDFRLIENEVFTESAPNKEARKVKFNLFMKKIKQDNVITEFDDKLWISVVECMTVYSKDYVRVEFKDGRIIYY